MNIQEKLKAEEGNYSSIVLYGDGSNWIHAYERSAYAFTKMIKKYEVQVQIPKNGGMTYCHIGFPVSALKNILKQYKYSKDCPDEKTKIWIIRTEEDYFSENEFQTWKRVSTIEQTKKAGEKDKDSSVAPADDAGKQSGPSVSNGEMASVEAPVLPEEARQALELVHEIHNLELTEYTPWMAMSYLVNIKKRIAQWKIKIKA